MLIPISCRRRWPYCFNCLNAVRAVAAGSDLLLYVLPADPSEFGISVDGLAGSIADAVRSGRIPEERLDDAASRVLELRRQIFLDHGE